MLYHHTYQSHGQSVNLKKAQIWPSKYWVENLSDRKGANLQAVKQLRWLHSSPSNLTNTNNLVKMLFKISCWKIASEKVSKDKLHLKHANQMSRQKRRATEVVRKMRGCRWQGVEFKWHSTLGGEKNYSNCFVPSVLCCKYCDVIVSIKLNCRTTPNTPEQ